MARSQAAKKRRQRERQRLKKQRQALRAQQVKTAEAVVDVNKKLDAVEDDIDIALGEGPLSGPTPLQKVWQRDKELKQTMKELDAERAQKEAAARARINAGTADDDDIFRYGTEAEQDAYAQKLVPDDPRGQLKIDSPKAPKPPKPSKKPEEAEVPIGSDDDFFASVKAFQNRNHKRAPKGHDDDADYRSTQFMREYELRAPVGERAMAKALRQSILALERQTDILTKDKAGQAFAEAQRQLSQTAPGGAEDAIRQISYLHRRANNATVGELKRVGLLVAAYQKVLSAQTDLSEEQRKFLTTAVQQVKSGVDIRRGREAGAMNRVGGALRSIFFDVLGIEDWAGLYQAFAKDNPLLGIAMSAIGHGVRAFRGHTKDQKVESLNTRLDILKDIEEHPFIREPQDAAAEPFMREQTQETQSEAIRREKQEHDETDDLLRKIDADEKGSGKEKNDQLRGVSSLLTKLLELDIFKGIAGLLGDLKNLPRALRSLSTAMGAIPWTALTAISAFGLALAQKGDKSFGPDQRARDASREARTAAGIMPGSPEDTYFDSLQYLNQMKAEHRISDKIYDTSVAGLDIAYRNKTGKNPPALPGKGKDINLPSSVKSPTYDSRAFTGLPSALPIANAVTSLGSLPRAVLTPGATLSGDARDAQLVVGQESGGKPGAVAADRQGSTSFGLFQFNDKFGVLSDFVNYLKTAAPDLYSQLVATGYDPDKTTHRGKTTEHMAVPAAFADAWKAIASKNPGRFAQLQMEYAANSSNGILQPFKSTLASKGIDYERLPSAERQAIFSTVNQFDPDVALSITRQALAAGTSNDPAERERQVIQAFTTLRSKKYKKGQSRYESEQDTLMAMVPDDTSTPPTRAQALGSMLRQMNPTPTGQREPGGNVNMPVRQATVVNAPTTNIYPATPTNTDKDYLLMSLAMRRASFGM